MVVVSADDVRRSRSFSQNALLGTPCRASIWHTAMNWTVSHFVQLVILLVPAISIGVSQQPLVMQTRTKRAGMDGEDGTRVHRRGTLSRQSPPLRWFLVSAMTSEEVGRHAGRTFARRAID